MTYNSYLKFTTEESGDMDFLENVWEKAAELAIKFVPERAATVVSVICSRLMHVGRHEVRLRGRKARHATVAVSAKCRLSGHASVCHAVVSAASSASPITSTFSLPSLPNQSISTRCECTRLSV